MSRLTGTDAYGLMEAYNNVYAPQELTEEQVWEEVETWVNSLLEEGYDLSDYTWEEMYESYIEEEQLMERGAPTDPKARAAYDARVAQNRAALGNTILYGNSAGKKPEAPVTRNRNVRGGGTIKPPAGTPSSSPTFQNTGGFGRYAPPSAQVKTPAPTTNTRTPSRLTPGVTTVPIRPRTPAPAPAPAARTPGATPAPATTKVAPAPAPTAGKVAPTPAPSASPARPSLSSQADEIRKMRAGSLARQGKTLESSTVSGTTKPAYQANSFDPFDVVKGHLIDEGYADTEEAALKIMANMSESWKNSIIG
jgi:hypothetical protein